MDGMHNKNTYCRRKIEIDSSCSSTSDDTIIMTDCQNRLQTLKGTRKVKEITAYSVDTCLIRYKPRLLEVPSAEYPCLDAAVAVLEKNAGGYVIQLGPGSHNLSHSICGIVDNLTIMGDCNPFVGVPFIQRCRTVLLEEGGITIPPDRTEFPFCHSLHSSCVGIGPFDLTITGGRTVRVTGVGRDPDFSGLCPDTRIIFFRRDGVLHERLIAAVDGNSITFHDGVPLTTIDRNRGVEGGNGFFIAPNVALTSAQTFLSIEVQGNLKIIGVELRVPHLFILDAPGGYVELSHCHIANNVTIQGDYRFNDPNVYTGLVFLWPASTGEAMHQAIVSANGHLQADTCKGIWKYCHFAATIHAAEVQNGAQINFLGSEFVRNCLALSVSTGSQATIYSTVFCGNIYAILARYMSTITSELITIPGLDLTDVLEGPWFIENIIAMIASYNAFIIVPNVRGYRNFIPFIIDAKLFTTIESNPVGTIYHWNSMILFLPNPFAPDPRGLGCVDQSNVPGGTSVSGVTLTSANVFGVTSPSFIQSIVGDTNDIVTADETLERLVIDSNTTATAEQRRLRFFVGALDLTS